MLKHICISDLHAGAPTSLAMTAPRNYRGPWNTVTSEFATALGAFVRASGPDANGPPQLILLGDLLDLQFSDRIESSRNALDFLTALRNETPLQDQILATAGNHDHALWTDARLGQEAMAVRFPDGKHTNRAATPAFDESDAKSRLLSAVVQEAGFSDAELRYPNIGLKNQDRLTVLHHGHFAEGAYHLISALHDSLAGQPRAHLTVDEICAENAGWLDFFWSSIGETGFATDASDLYQNLLTTTGYRNISRKLAKRLGHKLSEALPLSGDITLQTIIETLTQVGLDLVVGKYRDTERYAEIIALTDEGYEGLRRYLEGPVRLQLREGQDGTEDRDVTFVFGHTHKPFADQIVVPHYANPLKIYNTGGWTLNGPRLDNAEGAALVLIDEHLNVANLRIFGTPKNGCPPDVTVDMVGAEHASARAFRQDIQSWIASSATEWRALQSAAMQAYECRQAYLLNLTAAKEAAE